MPASLFEQTGFSLSLYEPLVQGGNYMRELTRQVSNWQHVKSSNLGNESANFEMGLPTSDLDEWALSGLGRHLILCNRGHMPIFTGFVNKVSLTYGGRKVDIGPLMDIANRVSVNYTPLNVTVYPPIRGATTTTVIAENLSSQAKYGILEKIVSAGDATQVDAEQLRDTFLAESAWPGRSESFDLRSTGEQVLRITLEVRGYGDWLGVYIFDSTTLLTTDVRTQILAVLTANPNTLIFSTDQTMIAANALLVPRSETGERTGLTVLQGLVALGDAADARYTFGVDEYRRIIYQPAPTVPVYQYRLARGNASIGRYGDNMPVAPWDVDAAQWCYFLDYMVGSAGMPIGEDPKAVFIESLTYSAPWGLVLTGGRNQTLPQKLAKLGLGGM